MSSTPNIKASSSKKNKSIMRGNVIDFESISLPSLKKYRSQFQIRIKPSVPKSELAAAIAEHFASIPVPEENEVIDQFFRALQKNRAAPSETEESSDEPSLTTIKKTESSKKKLKEQSDKGNREELNLDPNNKMEFSKNSLQSNSKKRERKNSVPKVEKSQSNAAR